MRRPVAIGFLVVVLALGALVLAYVRSRHHVPTVRGSTSAEHTRTLPPPRQPREPGVAWPLYGYDVERRRFASGVRLRPPLRRSWTFHAHALLEFQPVVGYGRIYLTNFDVRLFALDA